MKEVRIAFGLLIFTFLAVIINSVALRASFEELYKMVDAAEIEPAAAVGDYTEIFEHFKKKEPFISLTVNHEDLTAVEDAFAEIIGAAKADDKEAIITIKSRLISSIEHLKRLAGINIESIL